MLENILSICVLFWVIAALYQHYYTTLLQHYSNEAENMSHQGNFNFDGGQTSTLFLI